MPRPTAIGAPDDQPLPDLTLNQQFLLENFRRTIINTTDISALQGLAIQAFTDYLTQSDINQSLLGLYTQQERQLHTIKALIESYKEQARCQDAVIQHLGQLCRQPLANPGENP